MFAVGQVVFICVCFTFKGYIEVTLCITSVLFDSDYPFYEIPDIESNEEHLPLLKGVDVLMIPFNWIKRSLGKDYSEQVYCKEAFTKGDEVIVNYLHNFYPESIGPLQHLDLQCKDTKIFAIIQIFIVLLLHVKNFCIYYI